ncbi:MAG: hypothetical protein ACKO7Z_04135 [Cyanobacteriota bacterium]
MPSITLAGAPMEINRPGASALTPEQQSALERARAEIHGRALQGGLTSDDVQRIVAAMKAHPEVSHEVIQLLMEEVATLQGAGPGIRLLNLDD